MDLLTTILTCSLYVSDDSLVRAIAESTSQGNPYFVLDASVDLTQVDPPAPPKSAEEALARTHDLVAKGGRPLLGLLEVPASWMGVFGRELAGAFEPCTNIAVGSAMLSEFDAECARRALAKEGASRRAPPSESLNRRDARRKCVLGKYQDAIALADFAAATTLELRYQRPREPPVAEAPIFRAPSAPAWGPAELLVPLSPSLLKSLPSSNP